YKSVKYINERDIPDGRPKDNRIVDEVIINGQIVSQYIGLPVLIGVRKSIDKFSINVSAGFSPLFLRWQTHEIVSTNTSVIEVQPIRPGQSGSSQSKNTYKNLNNEVLISSHEMIADTRKRHSLIFCSAHVYYYLSSRFKVSAGPYYQRFLASVYPEESLIRQKPYSIGILFSLRYDLK